MDPTDRACMHTYMPWPPNRTQAAACRGHQTPRRGFCGPWETLGSRRTSQCDNSKGQLRFVSSGGPKEGDGQPLVGGFLVEVPAHVFALETCQRLIIGSEPSRVALLVGRVANEVGKAARSLFLFLFPLFPSRDARGERGGERMCIERRRHGVLTTGHASMSNSPCNPR